MPVPSKQPGRQWKSNLQFIDCNSALSSYMYERRAACRSKRIIVTLIAPQSVMIAQWDSSLSVLPMARVQFPATAEYFKRFFPGWSHSANPSWASVAENGSISPQRHHTTCGQRGGRLKFNHAQTMADRKKNCASRKYNLTCPCWLVSSVLPTLTLALAWLLTSALTLQCRLLHPWHRSTEISKTGLQIYNALDVIFCLNMWQFHSVQHVHHTQSCITTINLMSLRHRLHTAAAAPAAAATMQFRVSWVERG